MAYVSYSGRVKINSAGIAALQTWKNYAYTGASTFISTGDIWTNKKQSGAPPYTSGSGYGGKFSVGLDYRGYIVGSTYEYFNHRPDEYRWGSGVEMERYSSPGYPWFVIISK